MTMDVAAAKRATAYPHAVENSPTRTRCEALSLPVVARSAHGVLPHPYAPTIAERIEAEQANDAEFLHACRPWPSSPP